MKKILAAFLLSIFLVSQVFALPVPEPIKGTPFIQTKTFKTNVGNIAYKIELPSGWGIGGMQTSRDSGGYVHLFPVSGGTGCSIEINVFDNQTLAKNKLEDIRKTFSSVKNFEDGFEAKLSKAYYTCRAYENHLIQMWYSLPKKDEKYAKNWESLKNCLSLSRLSPPAATVATPPIGNTTSQEKQQKKLPVVELPNRGWAFNHPDKNLRVIFETWPLIQGKPNVDGPEAYLLKFNDWQCNGYFYVKWDQATVKWDKPAFNDRDPYQKHLQEMLQDILTIEPNQQFLQDPEFNEKSGYAILRGEPYGLITLAEDGFLYGFAVQDKTISQNHDINRLIKMIKWQKDN